MKTEKPQHPAAGFHVEAWSHAVGISRAGFYNLPQELRPATVRIGRRVIVTEAPANYLARIGELQRRAA